MLTRSASYLAHLDQIDTAPIVLIEIDDGTRQWQAVSASPSSGSDLLGVPEAVISVASVAEEIDPITREPSIGELVIDVLDEWIRPIAVNYAMHGRQVTAWLGAGDMDEAGYLFLFCGSIDKVEPNSDGTARISVLSVLDQLEHTQITAEYTNKHPLQALYNGAGAGVLEIAGLADFDAASFTPSNYGSSISHLVGAPESQHGTNSNWPVVMDRKALDVLSDICAMLHGCIRFDSGGNIEFELFSLSGSTVDTLTKDDFIEGSFSQEQVESSIVNRVLVRHLVRGDHSGVTYQADDATSQAAHAYPGASERVYSREFDNKWCGCFMMLQTSINDSTTTIALAGHPNHALTGARANYPAASQPADAQLSNDRPAYLLIQNRDGTKREIVKATAAAFSGHAIMTVVVDGVISGTAVSSIASLTVSRAQLGTTAAAHSSSGADTSFVWDITAAVRMAEITIKRCCDGHPPISVSVPLNKAHLQIGDLVAVVDDRYLSYGKDGITAGDKFEIVSREVTITGDSPQIALNLFYAGSGTPSIGGRGRVHPGPDFGAQQSADTDDVAQKWVADGLTVSHSDTLEVTVAAGTVSSGASRFGRIHEDVSFDVGASKDTWISVDAMTGAIASYPVANAAAEPDKPASETWIAKAVTNGADVTGITDLRAVKPVPGAKLVDLSVVEAKLGALSVTEGKIGALAVTEGKVGALAISEGKIAATADTEGKIGTGAVTANKLGTAAVTAVKVADQVIDDQHVYQQRRVVLNPNANLLRYR